MISLVFSQADAIWLFCTSFTILYLFVDLVRKLLVIHIFFYEQSKSIIVKLYYYVNHRVNNTFIAVLDSVLYFFFTSLSFYYKNNTISLSKVTGIDNRFIWCITLFSVPKPVHLISLFCSTGLRTLGHRFKLLTSSRPKFLSNAHGHTNTMLFWQTKFRANVATNPEIRFSAKPIVSLLLLFTLVAGCVRSIIYGASPFSQDYFYSLSMDSLMFIYISIVTIIRVLIYIYNRGHILVTDDATMKGFCNEA